MPIIPFLPFLVFLILLTTKSDKETSHDHKSCIEDLKNKLQTIIDKPKNENPIKDITKDYNHCDKYIILNGIKRKLKDCKDL